MYTITFYSFKGGVGRTMSLVNVAIELAKTGKRVLLVDFDLEAPGIDAFGPVRPKAGTPGIVEFVADYLITGTAPVATQYLSSCSPLPEISGELWVMPSGIRDGTYSARLSAVDWQDLYAQHDGYLLFEDLKAQWDAQLKPDYVLIDSRTGHTDVASICTRQLPDGVVLCFLPNEENLSGLEGMVKDIRSEIEGPLQRRIELFFVLSNIPDLDDEQNILSRRLQDAGRRLQFDDPTCTVHRYESLSLLDNVIFALERPNSKLATEYRQLTKAITASNLQDRDVALRFISGFHGGDRVRGRRGQSLDSKLQQIRLLHAKDGEVLYWLSRLVKRMGSDEESRSLLRQAELIGFRCAETMLDAAYLSAANGHTEDALKNLKEAIYHPTANYFDLHRAVRLCLQIDVDSLEWILASQSLRRLRPSEQDSLCEKLLSKREALPIAERVMRSIWEKEGESEGKVRESAPTHLVLCLIGQQKFREAMTLFRGGRPDSSKVDMVDAFNYAVAEWGATRSIPADLFRRVIELDMGDELELKNVRLCVAIAAWAIGDVEAARRNLARAEKLACDDDADSFSGWRYLQISAKEFQIDLAELRHMIEGALPGRPAILTRSHTN